MSSSSSSVLSSPHLFASLFLVSPDFACNLFSEPQTFNPRPKEYVPGPKWTPTDDAEGRCIKEHLDLRTTMFRIESIRKLLIEEVHAKKTNEKKSTRRRRFKIANKTVENWYRSILFMGRKSVGSCEPWPCHFIVTSEETFFKEWPGKRRTEVDLNLTDLYYHLTEGYFSVQAEPLIVFDKTQWELSSDSNTFNENDTRILKQFYAMQVACMEKSVARVKESMSAADVSLLQKECNRYKRCVEKQINPYMNV